MRQVFYPSEAPSPPLTLKSPPPLTHSMRVYNILIHTGKGGERGGEQTRENVRGAKVQKAGRKYQHD